MMSGHGLMWSAMFRPEKPEIRRRIDWKRMGALFAPYWVQQLTVLACILVASLLGLVPGFMTARIIDVAIPRRNLTELGIDVGAILGSALVAALIASRVEFTRRNPACPLARPI